MWAAYSYRDYLTGKTRSQNSIFSSLSIWPPIWGLDGVEPTSYYFPPDVNADYLNRLKLHAFFARPGHLGNGHPQRFLCAAR